MFYHFLYPLSDYYSPFNIFRYITFRTGGAVLTAFLIVFFLGPHVIRKMKVYSMKQAIRDDGPDRHLKKEGTPTMGGILILLGLNLSEGENHKAKFIGTGMHGGVIYLRGSIEDYQLGKEVGVADLEEADYQTLRQYVGEYANYFGYNAEDILKHKFIKLFPRWLRPYGRLYAY